MPNNKEVAKKIASSLGSYGLESLIKDILDCYYPVKQEPVGFRAMQGNMNVAVIFKDRFNPEQYEAIEKLHIKSFKSRMEYLYTSPVTDVEEIRRQFAQEILNGFINKSLDVHKYSFTVQEIAMVVNFKLKGGSDV